VNLQCRNYNYIKNQLHIFIGLYIALSILSFLLDYKELSFMTWRKIMSKKAMIAVCLSGLAWAGTAQAGFLGNNLELQWLQTSITHISTVDVTTNQTDTSLYSGITLSISDNPDGSGTLGFTGGLQTPADLTIVDINNTLDPIIGVSGLDNVSYGQNSDGHQYVLISGLNGQLGNRNNVDVTFASTVPEPGAFDLVALGLTILGMTTYQRKRVRA
jgi:hypothetical protein